ncbi:PepSY domain-containing protein [Staphylococcus felis]|uniref:PepSY domain-containing protein n=1 Tax=Staphylococcus felis TaxID=46127 RepID=UPI000E22D5F7|nr:PepSY domain-containing protein [Staphylococcus felis]REH78034.1 hypothetical protein DOS60_04365 [Staphylococcus felis]
MKFKILGMLLSAGVILAACGNDDDDNNQSNNNQNQNQTEQTNSTNDSDDAQDSDDQTQQNSNSQQTRHVSDIQTSPDQAIETAKKSFDGDLKSIEYKQENGEWIYEVNLVNGNEEGEVKVSDSDNKVINVHKEQDNDNEQNETINEKDAIKYEDAVKKAQDEVSGELKQWTLNDDDGQLVYEVELMDGTQEKEVQLDAKSGDIVSTDQ